MGVRFLQSFTTSHYTERTSPCKKNGTAVPGTGTARSVLPPDRECALPNLDRGRAALAQPVTDLAEQRLVLVADPVQVVDVLGREG